MNELYNDLLNPPIQIENFLFPGGEVGLKIKDWKEVYYQNNTTIVSRLHTSNDLIGLAMLKNAVLNLNPDAVIYLVCPYIPYARQDRICDKGEAFSLKVFADILNNMNFKRVTIYDPHSDVTPALINNVRVVNQLDIIKNFDILSNRIKNSNCVFVSPDAGANKKTAKLAGHFGHKEFVRADKLRDLTNGNIIETVVYCDDFKGKDVIIADDICDGGRTFIGLSEVLKKKNCGKVILYVTHGIFSRGVEHLLNNGLDEIYTTDSFTKNMCGDLPQPPKLNIFKIQIQ